MSKKHQHHSGRKDRVGTANKSINPIKETKNKSGLSFFKGIVILVITSFILYGNTLSHDYVLDDEIVYLKNKYVQSGFSGFGDIVTHGYITGFNNSTDQSYRPLVLLIFTTERVLFNNNPTSSHLINILLYVCCGISVWLLMKRLFSQWHPYVVFIGALLYLAHPIHTEVVANIKGRDDILQFIFSIGALLFAIDYSQSKRRARLYWSYCMFFLSLFCKEMAVTFLVIIPLTVWFFTNQDWKKVIISGVPYLILVVVYFLIRWAVLGNLTDQNQIHIINNALESSSNWIEWLSTALVMLVMYLKLLFFPHPLSWDYSFNQIPIYKLSDWQTILSVSILTLLFIVAVRGFFTRSVISWAVFFFFISISIVSNIIVPIGATFAERLVFTPSLSFSPLILLLLAKSTHINLSAKDCLKNWKFMLPIGLIFTFYGFKTIDRNKVWKNNFTLALSGVQTAPNSSRAWMTLGAEYRKVGETATNLETKKNYLEEALKHYKKSVEILDENFDAWYNIGVCYDQLGKQDLSLVAYNSALKTEPRFENALNNVGVIYFGRQQYDSARVNFERVVAINPKHVDALTNIGATFHNTGKLEDAVNWYLKAMQFGGNQNTARNLAKAYKQLGQPEKAKQYETFVQEN